MADVTMPRLSDTMQEGTIARWLKQPGETVARGDVLAEIETDKATMPLEAFDAGTLEEILAPEGETVPIGEVIARIGAGGADAAPPPQAPEPRRRERRDTPAAPEVPPPVEQSAAVDAAPQKVRATPLARHIAREHELDLASIQGSGPQGRVIRADVEAALAADAAPAEAPAEAPAAGPREEAERVPLSAMRRTIARRLAESTRTIPHFFLTLTVDATELVELRRQLLQRLEAAGDDTRISLNDLVVKAAALALVRVPEVNVSYTEEALLRHRRVHVGVAVALEQGLIVPVLRDADQKSVGQLAREARALVTRARAGQLQPAEYTGATFTVSNLGMYGIEQFNAVINPPEAAILAVGAITRQPVEHAGQIVLRERMTLTMSIDHRALDGATGARYLQELQKLLQEPYLLLV
jgi:pyruvate dehydrogenase E2 component (dihydrolipoamide acetyltransferase)